MIEISNQPAADTDEKLNVRKSLAMAAAYGIGPFKKRVRLTNPSPYEPEETYSSFAIDVLPPEPEWKYTGTLADKPVELLKTYKPRHLSDHTNEKSISFDFYKAITGDAFFGNPLKDRETYNNGFTFNRNGMHYRIKFYKEHSDWDPVNKFTISDEEITDMSSTRSILASLAERSMTRQEARYALDIICKELPDEDKARLSSEINRLSENLPTITVAPLTFYEKYKQYANSEIYDKYKFLPDTEAGDSLPQAYWDRIRFMMNSSSVAVQSPLPSP